MRTYSELSQLKTYKEKFEYLKLDGQVGKDTFGFDRYINQKLYKSKEWKSVRNQVIIRDEGCDLGDTDHPIYGNITIHHMNPITANDIETRPDYVLNPEYLICVGSMTHRALHYGDSEFTERDTVIERRPGDTCPWRK